MKKYSISSAVVVISLVALAIVLASCGGGDSGGGYSSDNNGTTTGAATQTVQIVPCPTSGTTDVSIIDNAFSPAASAVSLNAVVKWTNNGTMTHTVTSTTVPANGAFDSVVSPGASICLKFTSTGSYSYHCSIHPSMTGAVTVAGAPASNGGGTTGGTTGGTGGGTTY